jgi:transposase InsO family protein
MSILQPGPDRPSAQVSAQTGALHNGKIERFHQTMGREWAHGRSYPTSEHRASLLKDWLEHYNHRRPHSAIGNRPPIGRVHNV